MVVIKKWPSVWLEIYCICALFPDSQMLQVVIEKASAQTDGNLRSICNDFLRHLQQTSPITTIVLKTFINNYYENE